MDDAIPPMLGPALLLIAVVELLIIWRLFGRKLSLIQKGTKTTAQREESSDGAPRYSFRTSMGAAQGVKFMPPAAPGALDGRETLAIYYDPANPAHHVTEIQIPTLKLLTYGPYAGSGLLIVLGIFLTIG